MRIGPRTNLKVSYSHVSPYHALPAGVYVVRAEPAGFEVPVVVRPDSFVTIVLAPEGLTAAPDEPLRDPARALLAFYNLSTAPLDLRTADGLTPIVVNLLPGGRASREANAVTVALAVFEDQSSVAVLEPLVLRRGQAVAIFAFHDGRELLVRTVLATVVTP